MHKKPIELLYEDLSENSNNFNENEDKPKSLESVMEVLRDATTNVLMKRLKRSQLNQEEELVSKLHLAIQDLLYFRNVDGSFGEPLVTESLR